MNHKVFKYTLKVWLSSMLLLYPLTLIIIKIFQSIYIIAPDLFYLGASRPNGFSWLFIKTYREVIFQSLTFLIFFHGITEGLNKMFTNSQTLKIILTFLCILMMGVNLLYTANYFLINGKIMPSAFLLLLIIFVWIFRIDGKVEKVEMEDILDA